MIRRPPRSTLFPTRRSSDLIGSREAGADRNRTWHTADVRGFRRRETGGADFWKIARAQGAGIGRGNGQRAGGFATAGSRYRAALCDEPVSRPGGRAGKEIRGKGCRLGRMGFGAAVGGCRSVLGQRGRTASAARDPRASDGGTGESRIVSDGPGRAAEYSSRRR